MRVLMITPEAAPFAQTGGLGEVLSALPAELAELGVEIDVFMPKYRGVDCDKYDLKETGLKIEVDINARKAQAALWEFRDKRGARYLFVECDEYFDRDYLYGTPLADYEDNAERFVFLCRSAIEMSLAASTHYDIYHSHDWQAALAPVYLRTLYAGETALEPSASVVTIHNLGYQGIFWHFDMPLVGIGWEFFTPKHMEFHGRLNFLKSGIVFADEVNTVSSGYRDEILTPEFGFGLEGILQEKGPHLTGILNGVDYKTWDPDIDPVIAANYNPKDLSGKTLCKTDLQKISHLPARPDVPLVGMVSRLSDQKGIDILAKAVPELMKQDLQLVLLGTGEASYQASFREFGERYPDKTGIFLSYDYELAHKIFAGADALIVPSRYEPCGLTQLYALRYGTVPIVRATGGLRDTVEEFNPDQDSGTGFKFEQPEPSALEETLLNTLDVFIKEPDAWKKLMVRGMNRDFSWKRSATEYVRLYERAISDRMSILKRHELK